MHFFNFPYLVQTEIIQQMTYDAMVFLSFTSKRATKLIGSIPRKGISQISYEMITDKGEESIINILVRETTGKHVGVFSIGNELDGWGEHVKRIQLNKRFSCGFIQHNEPSQWPHLILKSDNLNSDPIIEAIHNQIDQIFGKNISYELLNHDNGGQTIFLPNFIKIKKFRSEEFKVKAEILDEYFSAQPKQKYIEYFEESIIGQLNSNSKIFEADELLVSCDRPNINQFTDVLNNFRGQILHLYRPVYNDEDVLQFLKNWKTKEKQLNLKTLRIEKFGDFDYEMIEREGGFKKLPELEHPPLYDRFFLDNYRNVDYPPEPKLQFHHYIVREDGIVAYVAVDTRKFYFDVQEFTEKEMMEKRKTE